jgi:hypothetical protein
VSIVVPVPQTKQHSVPTDPNLSDHSKFGIQSLLSAPCGPKCCRFGKSWLLVYLRIFHKCGENDNKNKDDIDNDNENEDLSVCQFTPNLTWSVTKNLAAITILKLRQ